MICDFYFFYTLLFLIKNWLFDHFSDSLCSMNFESLSRCFRCIGKWVQGLNKSLNPLAEPAAPNFYLFGGVKLKL